MSLTTGEVPASLKVPRVILCLKKKSLDKEQLSNYRPLSNLPFLSKTIERVIAMLLNDYLQENKLLSPLQSTYRRHHSVETALLRVTNDLLLALDSGREILLVLLDYSAAFILLTTIFCLIDWEYAMACKVQYYLGCLDQHTQYMSVSPMLTQIQVKYKEVYLGDLCWDLCYSRFKWVQLKILLNHTELKQCFTLMTLRSMSL